jgi:hypothetical protein
MNNQTSVFSDEEPVSAHRKTLMGCLFLAGVLACYFVAGSADADETETDDQYLGQLSVNPYVPESVSNPYGAGNRYDANSIKNPYGEYGSRYSNKSVANPYATDAPKLYDDDGNYRGRLSSNQYDAESVSNRYGRYGSEYSSESINNPFGAGNPFKADSPANPYGTGLGIYDGDSDGPASTDTATTPTRVPVYTTPYDLSGDD